MLRTGLQSVSEQANGNAYSRLNIMGSDDKDGGSSSLSSDFMSKLRAAEVKAHMRPDLRQRVLSEFATLRDDMHELKSLMRLVIDDILDGIKRLMQVQRRRKASKGDLAE